MTVRRDSGLTLVELIISITITAIVASAAAALLFTTLQAQAYSTQKSRTYREGLTAMDTMTRAVRMTSFLMIPNNHNPTRDLLATSDMANEDNDYYFGDPLFPRVDEDMSDRFSWSSYGVGGYDDDGDGATDEGGAYNDDEDAETDEDWINGLDDDGDGNIDEDPPDDMNLDGEDGIAGMDDDGDGQVDEGVGGNAPKDDDEDGAYDEEDVAQVVYEFRSSPGELWKVALDPNATGQKLSETLLATNVTEFKTTYEPPDATHGPRVWISLTLTDENGESVTFKEYAFPRNVLQRNGKRVR